MRKNIAKIYIKKNQFRTIHWYLMVHPEKYFIILLFYCRKLAKLKHVQYVWFLDSNELILSCSLIRTKLCRKPEPATHGRDLCTHLKLYYFPILYSRQSTLHASNHMSCLSPFCHIFVHQSYPSPFYPAFQNSAFPNFFAHFLHCHMNPASCCPGETKLTQNLDSIWSLSHISTAL